MSHNKGKDILEYLNRPLRIIQYSQEEFRMVLNMIETSDMEPCVGAKADGVVKLLAKKYYPYCKKSVCLPTLLNILYAIITGESCTVSYVVAAAVREAQQLKKEVDNRLPLEFFLSETLDSIISAPSNFSIFEEEDTETSYTLKSAIEGIIGKQLVFPSDTNRVVAYPDSPYFLLYVDCDNRWLGVVNAAIAGRVNSYTNPVVNTPKGLMQGETLLRFMNNRDGIVVDDYVII